MNDPLAKTLGASAACVPEPMREIPTAVTDMAHSVNELHAALGDLQLQLRDISQESAPTEMLKMAPANTSLGAQLHSIDLAVRQAAQWVREMQARLEV